MVNERQTTPTGYEVNFATNTLGTYILTTRLIPVLQNAENARVVRSYEEKYFLLKTIQKYS